MPKRKNSSVYVRRPRKKKSKVVRAVSTTTGKVSYVDKRTGLTVSKPKRKSKRKLGGKYRKRTKDRIARGLNPYFPPHLRQTLHYKQSFQTTIYNTYSEGVFLDDFYAALNLIVNIPHREMFVSGPSTSVTTPEFPQVLTPQGTLYSNVEAMYVQRGLVEGDLCTLPKHFKSLMNFYGAGMIHSGVVRNTVRLNCDLFYKAYETTVPATSGYLVADRPCVHIVYGIMDPGDWNNGNCLKPDLLTGWPNMTITQQDKFLRTRGWKKKTVFPKLDGTQLIIKLKTKWSQRKLWGPHAADTTVTALRYPYTVTTSNIRQAGWYQSVLTEIAGAPTNNIAMSNIDVLKPVVYFCYTFLDQNVATDNTANVKVRYDISTDENHEFGWRKDKWDETAADVINDDVV
nr:MAG: putative capsid protein [Arizlama virus]